MRRGQSWQRYLVVDVGAARVLVHDIEGLGEPGPRPPPYGQPRRVELAVPVVAAPRLARRVLDRHAERRRHAATARDARGAQPRGPKVRLRRDAARRGPIHRPHGGVVAAVDVAVDEERAVREVVVRPRDVVQIRPGLVRTIEHVRPPARPRRVTAARLDDYIERRSALSTLEFAAAREWLRMARRTSVDVSVVLGPVWKSKFYGE